MEHTLIPLNNNARSVKIAATPPSIGSPTGAGQLYPRQLVSRQTAFTLSSIALVVVTALVIAGEVAQKPDWAQFRFGAAMILNTAICFGLLVLALLSESLALAARRRVQTCIGLLVALIAVLVLGEYFLGIDFGIDWAALHRRYQGDNNHPWVMNAPAAFAFVLCGIVLMLMHRVRSFWSGLLVQALTVAVVALGSIGIIGDALKLILVYENYPIGQMTLPTAAGFVLSGIALSICWAQADWYRSRALVVDEAQRISLNSAVALAGIVCASMLTGLVLARQQIETLVGNNLSSPLKSRIDIFTTNIDLRSNRIAAIAARPEFVQLLINLNDRSDDQEVLTRLRESAASFLSQDIMGIALHSTDGRELARVGHLSEQAALKLELYTPSLTSFLMWSGEHFVLQTRVPIHRDGTVTGALVAQQRLTALTSALEYAHDFSDTGEISVCGRQGGQLACFPQRYVPAAFTVPYTVASPMALALENKTGVAIVRDQRNRNVMAAYGPIGNLGLGMVVKEDTIEVYAPLREHLHLVLLLGLAMVAGGTLLLFWRVLPLARNLYSGEQRLKLALESSRTAWWDLDIQSGKIQLSEQWQFLLGEPAQMTTTTLDDLEKLVHPDDLPLVRRKLRAAMTGGAAQYDVEHRVRKPDGSWLWVYSIGKVVKRDRAERALRMVGINSDISQRKEIALRLGQQALHDAVTDLPNRFIFVDRLQHATLRARHNKVLIGVVYLDVDQFEQINNHFGKAVGDALLKGFAQRLETCIRPGDTLARMGSDSYALILEDLESSDDGLQIVQKIRDAAGPEFVIEHRTIGIAISPGIAFYYGHTDEPAPDALLQAAISEHHDVKIARRHTGKVAA